MLSGSRKRSSWRATRSLTRSGRGSIEQGSTPTTCRPVVLCERPIAPATTACLNSASPSSTSRMIILVSRGSAPTEHADLWKLVGDQDRRRIDHDLDICDRIYLTKTTK